MTRHLIDAWHDRLVLELRLREVPGPRIGDVLAEVDAHCAATGETPEEAFGDPERYAESVAEALGARPTGRGRTTLLALGSTASLLAVLEGAAAVGAGGPAAVSVGDLLMVAAVTAATVLTIGAVLTTRPRSWRTWSELVAAAVLVAVGFAGPVLAPAGVVDLPAWPTLLLGAAGLVAVWRPRRGELVLDPRTGREPFRRQPLLAAVRWAPLALLVLAAIALVVVEPPA